MIHYRLVAASFVLILYHFTGIGQIKDIGLPFIVNHNRSSYNASNQNWAITQNNKGFMYFGNNDGILEFDGTQWSVFPMPNRAIVRSIMAKGDTVFAGAFEQIGYLASNSKGLLEWTSLNHLIPQEYLNFDEVWKIFHDQHRVVFQSFRYIFIYDGDSMRVLRPQGSYRFMHQVGSEIYVVDQDLGLMQLVSDSLVLASDHDFFLNNEIICILPHSFDEFIVGTNSDGLFLWKGNEIQFWDTEVSQRVKQNNLFSAILLGNHHYAFGSISNGVYVSDQEGRVLQHVNRVRGLQNNTILAQFQDRRNNLWLGLDNGIDFLELSSPVTILNHNYNIESAYVSLEHEGILYVGTNQGLFAAKQNNRGPSGGIFSDFQIIRGTEGQVWTLQVIDNTLLCGHNNGCFQIDGFSARQMSGIRTGVWSFLDPNTRDNFVIAGTYTGLIRLQKVNNEFYYLDEIEGFTESSREMYLDSNHYMWVSHGYKGLFRLKINNDFSGVLGSRLYLNNAGLPNELPYNIQIINTSMRITTREGILKFDYDSDQFIEDPQLNLLFEGKGFIDKIHQDSFGNLWYFTSDHLGVMRLLEDGTFRDIKSPFTRITNYLLPAFQNIFVSSAQSVYVGGQNGLIHYNPAIINDYNLAEDVYFQEISFYGNDEVKSFFLKNASPLNLIQEPVEMPFRLNSVIFRFTSTVYENPGRIVFSYRLSGFENHWSNWDGLNFKEYTNLREGDYIFQVKAINAFGVESLIRDFRFTVKPPFFRSHLAYAVFGILLLLILVANVYFERKRIKNVKEKEKLRHEKRLERRERIFREQTELSEREIMHLRNEKLQNEMIHKNKELANATLHLIQKNKTLTSLKNDLTNLLKITPSDKPEKQIISNVMKKVNRDLRNEKNWELFNNYFDEVHQDFITRLKHNFEDLTPKELRLCAYLRMNLSTKEIAPLMNISVRGVEISRYRLRKKLQIDHEINLSDFLISY
jgi:ligand-binding sensor domain-containing protein